VTPHVDYREISAVRGLLAGRWVLSALAHVASEPMRHRELLDTIDGISEKVLTGTLRRMERGGLIVREVGSGVPSHVVHCATTLAQTLDEPLRAMLAWKRTHWDAVETSRLRWDNG